MYCLLNCLLNCLLYWFAAVDEHNKALVFWQKPMSVLSGASIIAKGKLISTPVMPMVNIGVKELANSVSFGKVDGTAFFGSGAAKPRVNADLATNGITAFFGLL